MKEVKNFFGVLLFPSLLGGYFYTGVTGLYNIYAIFWVVLAFFCLTAMVILCTASGVRSYLESVLKDEAKLKEAGASVTFNQQLATVSLCCQFLVLFWTGRFIVGFTIFSVFIMVFVLRWIRKSVHDEAKKLKEAFPEINFAKLLTNKVDWYGYGSKA